MNAEYVGYATLPYSAAIDSSVPGTDITLIRDFPMLNAACATGYSSCMIDRQFLRGEYKWTIGDINRNHSSRTYHVYLAQRCGVKFIIVWINTLTYAGPHEGYPWRHVTRVMTYDGPEPDIEACRLICDIIEPEMCRAESSGFQLDGIDVCDSADRAKMIELLYRLGLLNFNYDYPVSYEQLLTLRIKDAFDSRRAWQEKAEADRNRSSMLRGHESLQLIRLTFKNELTHDVAMTFGDDIAILPADDGYSTAAILAVRDRQLDAWANSFTAGSMKMEYA